MILIHSFVFIAAAAAAALLLYIKAAAIIGAKSTNDYILLSLLPLAGITATIVVIPITDSDILLTLSKLQTDKLSLLIARNTEINYGCII